MFIFILYIYIYVDLQPYLYLIIRSILLHLKEAPVADTPQADVQRILRPTHPPVPHRVYETIKLSNYPYETI